MTRRASSLSAGLPVLVGAIWGILVWSNWLFHNPVPAAQLKAAFRAYSRVDWLAVWPALSNYSLWAAGLLLLSLAALGAGRPVDAFLRERSKSAGPLCRCALGAGALSISVLGMGFCGLAFSGPAWILTVLGALLGLGGPILRGKSAWKIGDYSGGWRTAPAIWLAAGTVLAVFIALTGALAPARAYDALFHHLAHPQIFAENHKVIGLPHHFLSYYPALLEMQYLLAMLLGGGLDFAKLIHFLWGALVLAILFRWARESLPVSWALAAVLGFCLLPYVQLVMMWGYVDLGAAAYLTLAFWLACGRRTGPAVLGVLCGFCAGTKASGLFAGILTAALLAARGARRRDLTVFGVMFVLATLPWGVRNWALSGNPFAPFLVGRVSTLNLDAGNMARYSAELTSYVDQADMAGGILSLLASPWNSSIRNFGVLDKLGGMGAWFLFALPCLLLYRSRTAKLPALLAGGYFLLWLSIPRQVRYLLPVWPVAAVAVAHALREMAGRGRFASLAASGAGALLVIQLLAAFQRQYFTADPLRVAFGTETREAYLERGIGGRPYSIWVKKWLQESVPGKRVMIVSDFALGALWGPKAIFQSAFDTPLIEKIARESLGRDAMEKKFRQLNVRHVLYGAVGGFPMQREYGIYAFDGASAFRWRDYWRHCAKPVHDQNGRYIVFALDCSRGGTASVLPGADEQALADVEGRWKQLEATGRLREESQELVEEYGRIAREWSSPLAFEQMGWLLLGIGRPTAAGAALRRAEQLGRESASLHYAQGLLAMRDSDFAGAITRFKRCLKLDPTMQEARGRLADLLTQLGRAGEARELMNWRQ